MLFGCPPPPAPNLWKLEKWVFTVQKYIAPNFQYSIFFFFFFFWEFWSFKKNFQVVVVNLLTF